MIYPIENTTSVTYEMLNNQLDVLNSAYKPLGISFKLVNVTATQYDDLQRGLDYKGMKETLR